MEVLTSEVRFTDRIFKFKHNYIDHVFTDTVATSTSFDTLYYSITGNDSSNHRQRLNIYTKLFSLFVGAVADPGYFPRPYIRQVAIRF